MTVIFHNFARTSVVLRLVELPKAADWLKDKLLWDYRTNYPLSAAMVESNG
jgi:hypothetical protein